MGKRLKEDIAAFRERDPAARSNAEIFFCYSGLKAIRSHRVANFFYRHNHKFLARAISQRARHKTGIPPQNSGADSLSTTVWASL